MQARVLTEIVSATLHSRAQWAGLDLDAIPDAAPRIAGEISEALGPVPWNLQTAALLDLLAIKIKDYELANGKNATAIWRN